MFDLMPPGLRFNLLVNTGTAILTGVFLIETQSEVHMVHVQFLGLNLSDLHYGFIFVEPFSPHISAVKHIYLTSGSTGQWPVFWFCSRLFWAWVLCQGRKYSTLTWAQKSPSSLSLIYETVRFTVGKAFQTTLCLSNIFLSIKDSTYLCNKGVNCCCQFFWESLKPIQWVALFVFLQLPCTCFFLFSLSLLRQTAVFLF